MFQAILMASSRLMLQYVTVNHLFVKLHDRFRLIQTIYVQYRYSCQSKTKWAALHIESRKTGRLATDRVNRSDCCVTGNTNNICFYSNQQYNNIYKTTATPRKSKLDHAPKYGESIHMNTFQIHDTRK